MNLRAHFIALALLAALPAAHAADARQAPRRAAASGPGLLVAAPASGGLFAAGATADFRILNASPQAALARVTAKATAASGFRVVSNACPASLAPRESCTVSVRWTPVGGQKLASGVLTVASGSLEVESALTGDAALSP